MNIPKTNTARTMAVSWILALTVLFMGFVGATFIPDFGLPQIYVAVILFFAGIVGILESFFEGKKFSLNLKTPPADMVTLSMSMIALGFSFGVFLGIGSLTSLLMPFNGGIMFAMFLTLFFEGILDRS